MLPTQIYRDALWNRFSNPPSRGLYKLKEFSEVNLEMIVGGLDRVRENQNGNRTPLPGEEVLWMMSLFESIPRLLGAEVLPSIAALIGDGMDWNTAMELYSRYRIKIEECVSAMDEWYQFAQKLASDTSNCDQFLVSALFAIIVELAKALDQLLDQIDIFMAA